MAATSTRQEAVPCAGESVDHQTYGSRRYSQHLFPARPGRDAIDRDELGLTLASVSACSSPPQQLDDLIPHPLQALDILHGHLQAPFPLGIQGLGCEVLHLQSAVSWALCSNYTFTRVRQEEGAGCSRVRGAPCQQHATAVGALHESTLSASSAVSSAGSISGSKDRGNAAGEGPRSPSQPLEPGAGPWGTSDW